MGQEIPSFLPFLTHKLLMGMSDYNENQSHLMTRMDDAFCARMRAAIEAGLESAPIGVITTPGTKNPKFVSTEPRLLGFSLVEMDV
ncbi:MAG TPA: hypothetical protein VIH63_00745 [Xanthobacteraceae bacterium]